ncbi:MAG: IS630 family transposase [Thermoplasmata archaeon]
MSEQEIEDLRVFMRSAKDARLLKRAQMIWLSHLGRSVKEIADLLDIHPETVREWIHRYEEGGLEGLRDEPRPGRPPLANSLYMETMLELVPKSPRIVGYPWNNWTLGSLRNHLHRITGIRISEERVRQLLGEHGVRFTRPKLHLVSPDPEYDEKKARIEELKKNVPKDSVLLFEDETELHLNPAIERKWQSHQERILAAGQDRKINLFGVVDYETEEVHHRHCKRKRSVDFIGFLWQLLRAYPGRRILIVLDNYVTHKTEKVLEFLQRTGERIKLIFLPTYSPQLNIIEPWWKYVRSKVASNINHGNIDGLKRVAKGFYRAYKRGTVLTFNFNGKSRKNLFGTA